MKYVKSIALICLSLTLVYTAMAFAKEKVELPEVTVEGLVRVPDSNLAIVYADPEADLAQYERVKLLETHVAFKKNWQRNYNRSATSAIGITSSDMERMKNDMAREFNQVFTEVLEKGGYPVVDEAAEDVLLVRAAIVDLNPTAPDTRSAGISRTYTQSAGDMSLYIELYDSQTGDIMAKALDRQVDGRHSGFYTWANPASNSVAAKRILRGWATILLDALNEAKK